MPASIYELKNYNPYDAYLNDIADNRFRYGQFQDKIKNLTEESQDFIFGASLADFIKDRISLPLGLNENQSKETAKIVMGLILADWYLGDAVNQIIQRLKVDEQKAKTIAGMIVAELLAPILEDLKKMHIEKFAKNTPLQSQQQNDDRIVNLKQSL